MSIPVISINNLVKKFGNFYAVNGATFEIMGERIHGFVGPNGAGKTTTMKMIMGAIIPTSGSGTVMGHEIGSVEAKKLLGYSPEFPAFYSDMTALDYLIYMALLGRIGYREACYKADEMLEIMGLREQKDKKVTKFSTGMKKKVGLAQAMIHDPSILLLDEPTANLDPSARMDIIDNLKTLVEERKLTVVISSHVLSELEQIITDVTLINKGKILRQGTVSEIGKDIKRGHYIIETSDNARMSSWIYDMTSVFSVSELGKNRLKVITDDGDELKRFIIARAYQEDILIHHISEDKMTLENIYKSIFVEGVSTDESNIQSDGKEII